MHTTTSPNPHDLIEYFFLNLGKKIHPGRALELRKKEGKEYILEGFRYDLLLISPFYDFLEIHAGSLRQGIEIDLVEMLQLNYGEIPIKFPPYFVFSIASQDNLAKLDNLHLITREAILFQRKEVNDSNFRHSKMQSAKEKWNEFREVDEITSDFVTLRVMIETVTQYFMLFHSHFFQEKPLLKLVK